MLWLLAVGLGVWGVWLASHRLRFRVYEQDNGTWTFAGYADPGNKLIYTDPGPFASEAAATVAGAAWVAKGGPLPLPPSQGGEAPPVAPPLPPVPPPVVVPYLRVTSPPVTALATASATGATWSKYGGAGGDQSGEASSAADASSDVLSAVNSSLPASAPVTIELRRADGSTRRSVVSQINLQTWQWSIVTPPANPGGVGTSKTDASWRTLSRLASMRAALAMLQGGG